jgi:hypothetical protein
MAKIVDPDQLNQGVEVVISTAQKTIQLLVAGNLSDAAPGKSSGVTVQAVYSFLKEEWRTDAALNKFKFPLDAIYEAKFELVNGWDWADEQSRDLLRDGGWKTVLTSAEYTNLQSLGDFDAPLADLAYYQQTGSFTAPVLDFDKTGELNEPIMIFSGTFNRRNFLKVFLREQAKLYSESNLLADQDLAALTYAVYKFPLDNGEDINIEAADAVVDAAQPYTGMYVDFRVGALFEGFSGTKVYQTNDVVRNLATTRWFRANAIVTGTTPPPATGWDSYPGERQIGTDWYAFNRIINGNFGSAEEIYTWAQRQLRKPSNINGNAGGDGFGQVNGEVAVLLLAFLGSTLQTNPGVYIDSFDVNDQNRLEFFDITVDGGGLDTEFVPALSTKRTFPFVAAGSLVFSQNLVDEPNPDTLYRMYYEYTRQDIQTDVAVTNVSGTHARLESTLMDFTDIAPGEYFSVAGFANSVNNGIKQAVAQGQADLVQYADVAARVQITEGVGPSVTVKENPYDSAGAIVVNDNDDLPIQGQVTGTTHLFSYDYDFNIQGERTPATDAAVVVVAQGLAGAEWVDAGFTINRNTGLTFPVNASDERNYSNP